MIRFINGGVGSNREELFIGAVFDAAKNGRNVIVMIPDQFSFEYDKKLYDRLGAVSFNRITTAGFNRLAELLENEYGGGNGTGNAGENAKIILMYKALKTLRADGKICYYTKLADKNGLEKGNFISRLIELVQQMRESGISSEAVVAAAEMLKGDLAQKMGDIGRIYAEYMKQLENAGLHDSVSSIANCVKIARENDYFNGADVFIDAFSSFTYDEMRMIELCFAQADNVTVSFVIDADSVRNSIHPFRLPLTTFGILKGMAKNKGYEIVNAEESNSYSKDIAFVSKNLFNIAKPVFDGEGKNVRILNADDVYSEAMFVCAQMKRLSQQGYRYSDMAVILRNMQDSGSVFESMLEKYDIPYFIDRSDRVSASSIVHYFTAVFNCITPRKYKTENILKLVKSPFFSPNKHNANIIEQYCLKWNIDGDMWSREYFGLDISLVKEESMLEHIKTVEAIRKRIIEPFEKIRAVCCHGEIPASEMCEAFFALLNDMGVSKRAYSVVRTAALSGNDTQIELSRGLRQLWNSILSAVKSIYDCLENDMMSLRQFYELFRVMVSQMSVSDPPQKMDCIRIADASHSRLGNIKAAFICQVNDGVFPKSIDSNSLLSRVDMSQLHGVFGTLVDGSDRMLGGDVRYTLMREELTCYNAVSAASDKLFITYINADLTGEEKQPSSLVADVLKCFNGKKDEKISEIPLEFFCTSAKTAFHIAAEHFKDDDPSVEAIKMSLDSSEYASRLSAMRIGAEKLAESAKTSIDKQVSTQAFFKDGAANISASQIDTYYKCPFSYFCRYGLKLRPIEVMDMSSRHKGTLVHRVLEIVFSHRDENGELLFIKNDEKTDEMIKELITKCFDEYYNDTLNSDFGKSRMFDYNYDLLKNITYTIVKYVQSEILVSNYKPEAAEYVFGADKNGRFIRFETNDGRTLSVTGSIDRVDKSVINGKEYIRVIDYKTGKIDLDEAHLMCGLNLQMLIYLDAYLKCEDSAKLSIPAAIEYMSFGEKIDKFRDSDHSPDEYKTIENKSVVKAFKPKGIVDGSADSITTFNNGSNTLYSYAPFKKDLKDTVSGEELYAIRKYAEQKVIDFGNALENGLFPMNSVGKTCDYCDYRSVCGRDKYGDTSGIEDNKDLLSERFRKVLSEIIKNEKGGEQ